MGRRTLSPLSNLPQTPGWSRGPSRARHAGPVKEALFSVPLADLDYGDRELDEEIPLAWLTQAFEGTEATVRKPGRLTVTLSKNGREVMVRGKARAYVTMPCARTLDPVDFDLEPEIFLLLAPPGHGNPRPSPKP